MKISRVFLIGFVLASLAMSWGCAGTSPTRTDRLSIPRIAEIGGVQIGYSTQEELERRWGEGLTVVGGHPNSGRRWRVRDTDWVVATDGFLYSDHGLVIDGLQIESQPAGQFSTNAPFAKLDKKAFEWLGEISRGMTRLEVITLLNRQMLKFKEQDETLFVDADGFSAITSEANANLRYWQARLVFAEGKLTRLELEAAAGRQASIR